jgi:hypothetical protein
MSDEKEFIIENWLYAGRKEGTGTKIWNQFMPIKNGELTDDLFSFELKKSDLVIGGIYEVPVFHGEGGNISIRSTEMKLVDRWEDESKVQEFALRERIFIEKQKEARLMKKYQKQGEFELPETLDEMIRVYRKLRGTERRYFFAILERALEYKKID